MDFDKKKLKKSARITYSVFWNLTLIFIILGLVFFAFAGGVGAGYFASLVKDEKVRTYDSMKKDIYNYEETTELYFSDNIYLGKIRSDLYRDEVRLEEVSQYVIDAVIATEDQYFYDHSGVVPKAIIRALLQEFTNSSTKSGGSTLTQQLIKNQILTNEVSFERKAKEIMLALRLERFFDKEEILEAYLNVVPFGRNSSGRNIAGIQAAAQGIFGVNASELNLPQAAYIAGLPQSPFGYTPFTNKGEIKNDLESGLSRMRTVLNRMLTAETITEEQYKEAVSYDIKGNLAEPQPSPVQKYPWLTYEIEKRAVDILKITLAKEDGYTEDDLQNDEQLDSEYKIKADRNLRRNGYKIYTTIDKQIYDEMQEIKNNYEYYGSDKATEVINPETGERERILEPVEVGAMLIENGTGKIISFVGGRDHEKEQLNHATTGKRSNGSTMKPLLVYGPGIELGAIQPGSVFADVEVEIQAGNSVWEPENYGGKYHGLTSARYALARSFNVPAAKIYTETIKEQPVAFLEKMGFTSLTEGDYNHLSMALGALDNGVTVEENVNAYSTFANGGKFIDAYMIEKIESKDGETVYQHESESVDVFSPQTAYLTLDMMRDVIRSGTAAGIPSKLKFSSDWAGKTGTSQDYRDSWFVASNPNVTFGVWMGYDTPKPMETSYKGYSYSQRNQMLWAQLMNSAHDVDAERIESGERFKMPGGIVRRSYCAVSGLLPSKLCEEVGLVKTDLFNSDNVPKKEDNNLEKGKYVVINGKRYMTEENTPEEFTKEGIMLKPEFLETMGLETLEDIDQLLPDGDPWTNIIVTEKNKLKNREDMPSKMRGISWNGNFLTWKPHNHDDIIGYRIYSADEPTSTFRVQGTVLSSAERLEYKIKETSQLYYVTAVDIYGNESEPSETMSKYANEIPNPINDDTNDEEEDTPQSSDNTDETGNEKDRNNDSSNNPDDIKNKKEDEQEEDDIPNPLEDFIIE